MDRGADSAGQAVLDGDAKALTLLNADLRARVLSIVTPGAPLTSGADFHLNRLGNEAHRLHGAAVGHASGGSRDAASGLRLDAFKAYERGSRRAEAQPS
ncbi:hypothetical protein GGQ19_002613 [Salinibacter ruber]|uniref:hypothetical protein n=1 Tax=Salinibacter ruber TaxID=146919 RepID=UPI0021687083|nr:hypothetical protein [Salinibacter ruber]MCS3638747.1 hypothetical protein [Salinibacter ruber]MCS3751418.1 hypothetical protein [Salinibacter ruber]